MDKSITIRVNVGRSAPKPRNKSSNADARGAPRNQAVGRCQAGQRRQGRGHLRFGFTALHGGVVKKHPKAVAAFHQAGEEVVEGRSVSRGHESDVERESVELDVQTTARREQAMWNVLEDLGQEITNDAERQADAVETSVSTVERVGLALSASFLAVLQRGGSLLAMALSSLPVWRTVDPLAVLALSKKERDAREKEIRAAEEDEDEASHGLGGVLDGERDPDADTDSDRSENSGRVRQTLRE